MRHLLCVILGVWCLALSAPASDAADAARRQAAAKERLAHLTDALRRLIAKYASRPEEAEKKKRLEEALARLDGAGISSEMEEVLRALESSDVDEAKARASKAREALRQILDALTMEAKRAAIEERQRTLEDAARALEDAARKQQDLADEARRIAERASPDLKAIRAALDSTAAAQAALLAAGELGEARAKAAELLGKQKEMNAAASPSSTVPAGRQARQEALAGEARDLAGEIARMPESGEAQAGSPPAAPSSRQAAAKAASAAAESMGKAAKEGSSAAAEGKKAEQALDRTIAELDKGIAEALSSASREAAKAGIPPPPGAAGKPDAGKIQEALARKTGELAKKTAEAGEKPAGPAGNDPKDPSGAAAKKAAESAASRMQSASQQMEKARSAMDQPQMQVDAPGYQRQAIESLAAAREALDELARTRLAKDDRLALERLRKKQEEIREETQKIADAMKLDKDLSKKAAAEAQKAADLMAIVEGMFREEFLDSGIWEADEARKYLARAAASVRDKQREYASEQMKVTLSGLQKELDRLIAGQEETRKGTAALLAQAVKEGGLGVWGEESVAPLAEEQMRLAGFAASLKEGLSDPELKSVVYLWAAGEALDKMTEAGMRLTRKEISPTVTELQDEALFLLKEMRGGLKGLLGRLEEEKKSGRKPRPMAPGGDMALPFVRDVDEIRMILGMQKELNARVARLAKEVGADGTLAAAQRENLERLMRDQAKIRELGNDWRLNVYQEQR